MCLNKRKETLVWKNPKFYMNPMGLFKKLMRLMIDGLYLRILVIVGVVRECKCYEICLRCPLARFMWGRRMWGCIWRAHLLGLRDSGECENVVRRPLAGSCEDNENGKVWGVHMPSVWRRKKVWRLIVNCILLNKTYNTNEYWAYI